MKTVYRIRVKSQLQPYWIDWFGGMAITNYENGEAELEGPIEGQEALHRILEKIRDLNIGLISIEQTDDLRNRMEAEMDKNPEKQTCKEAKINDLTQNFLWTASPEFQPIVIRLTEIIESSKEPLSCEVKWGQLTYAKNGDFHHWLVGIKVTKKFVGLVFHFGGLLNDPQGIFIRGASKFGRKIEYRRVDDVESEIILGFLEQALEKLAYFKGHWKEIQAGS